MGEVSQNPSENIEYWSVQQLHSLIHVCHNSSQPTLKARVQAGMSPQKKQRKVVVLDDSDDSSASGAEEGSGGTPSADGSTPPAWSAQGKKIRPVPGHSPPARKEKKELDRIMASRSVKGKTEYLVKFKGAHSQIPRIQHILNI